MDYILNGQGFGSVASALLKTDFNVNTLRPFEGKDGRTYVTVMENGVARAVPLAINSSTLRRDEWKVFDDAVQRAARPRMRAWADLRARGLQKIIPNGLGKTVLESETMGDITPATISMDGERRSESDRVLFDIQNLPLPIIHKDFDINLRQLAISRNGSTPLDTTMAELAAEKVAEEAEKLTIGTASSYSFAGGTIYGYINFPGRHTFSLQDPEDLAWVPNDTVKDVIAMRTLAQNDNHNGPYVLYVSKAWDAFLDEDYSAAKGDNTLRERIQKLEDIESIRALDYLTGYQMILVEMKASNVRAVVGMDITTLQWESAGGMKQHFKVMAILVPQLRTDHDGQSGIVHGVVS